MTKKKTPPKGNSEPKENKEQPKMGANAEAQAPLVVRAQYVKDLSFENVGALTNSANEERPAISIHIEAKADNLEERTFEVSLKTQVDAKRKDNQVFLLDLEYAGIFTIGNDVPEQYIRPILMIECPRILFPFARNIVATTIQEGGYPSLLLTPVDFADLYQRQVAQEQAKEGKQGKAEGVAQ